jgi:TPR repeat protein
LLQCLGEHYLNGIGTETNRVAAREWLQRAAAQGDPGSSNLLLVKLAMTNSVSADEESIKTLLKTRPRSPVAAARRSFCNVPARRRFWSTHCPLQSFL